MKGRSIYPLRKNSKKTGRSFLKKYLLLDSNHRHFSYYQCFYRLFEKYPRFIHSKVSYNEIRAKARKIEDHFKENPSSDEMDTTSPAYWKVVLTAVKPLEHFQDESISKVQREKEKENAAYTDTDTNIKSKGIKEVEHRYCFS